VASALDPAFNLWDSVEPYAQQLIREERGNVAADFGRQALDNLAIAWRLPGRLDSLIERIDGGTVAFTSPAIEKRVASIERLARRAVSAVLFAGLLVAGAVVRGDDVVFGTVLMAVSALPLLHALFGGRRVR
jgi:predicted unusual protein kinase regulating ubiquinone biosynthesis (AarF/ABC1/UbiB family)